MASKMNETLLTEFNEQLNEQYKNMGALLEKVNKHIGKLRQDKIALELRVIKLESDLKSNTKDIPYNGYSNYITWSVAQSIKEYLEWVDDDDKEDTYKNCLEPDGVNEVITQLIEENTGDIRDDLMEYGRRSINVNEVIEEVSTQYEEWKEQRKQDEEKEDEEEDESDGSE